MSPQQKTESTIIQALFKAFSENIRDEWEEVSLDLIEELAGLTRREITNTLHRTFFSELERYGFIYDSRNTRFTQVKAEYEEPKANGPIEEVNPPTVEIAGEPHEETAVEDKGEVAGSSFEKAILDRLTFLHSQAHTAGFSLSMVPFEAIASHIGMDIDTFSCLVVDGEVCSSALKQAGLCIEPGKGRRDDGWYFAKVNSVASHQRSHQGGD